MAQVGLPGHQRDAVFAEVPIGTAVVVIVRQQEGRLGPVCEVLPQFGIGVDTRKPFPGMAVHRPDNAGPGDRFLGIARDRAHRWHHQAGNAGQQGRRHFPLAAQNARRPIQYRPGPLRQYMVEPCQQWQAFGGIADGHHGDIMVGNQRGCRVEAGVDKQQVEPHIAAVEDEVERRVVQHIARPHDGQQPGPGLGSITRNVRR